MRFRRAGVRSLAASIYTVKTCSSCASMDELPVMHAGFAQQLARHGDGSPAGFRGSAPEDLQCAEALFRAGESALVCGQCDFPACNRTKGPI